MVEQVLLVLQVLLLKSSRLAALAEAPKGQEKKGFRFGGVFPPAEEKKEEEENLKKPNSHYICYYSVLGEATTGGGQGVPKGFGRKPVDCYRLGAAHVVPI